MTKNINWDTLDGMILMSHGVFTFDHDPKRAYENMIDIVTKAENYLKKNKAATIKGAKKGKVNALDIAKIRKQISTTWGAPILTRLDDSAASVALAIYLMSKKSLIEVH